MASSSSLTSPRSEDILSAKTDLCISNGIVKAGLGLGGGIVASAIIFKRRPWPVLLGLGFGIGNGYSDCQRIFNPASIPGFVIAPTLPTSSSNLTSASTPSPFEFVNSAVAAVKKEIATGTERVKEAVSAEKVGEKPVVEKVEASKDGKKWV